MMQPKGKHARPPSISNPLSSWGGLRGSKLLPQIIFLDAFFMFYFISFFPPPSICAEWLYCSQCWAFGPNNIFHSVFHSKHAKPQNTSSVKQLSKSTLWYMHCTIRLECQCIYGTKIVQPVAERLKKENIKGHHRCWVVPRKSVVTRRRLLVKKFK